MSLSLDTKSILIGAVAAGGALMVLGTKKAGKTAGKKKSKGLGSTYVVSGRATKVTKKAKAVRKAAGVTKRRATKKK